MNIHFQPQAGEFGRTEGSNGTYDESAMMANFGDMSQSK